MRGWRDKLCNKEWQMDQTEQRESLHVVYVFTESSR